MDDALHDELDGFPPTDENGVDLSQLDYMLSLTPAERLRRAQSFANFILNVRRLNGIEGNPWESLPNDNSTGTSSSAA
jgi:hypothetical protein